MHVIIGTDDGIHDLGGPRALAGHTITAVLPGPPPCPAIVDGELLVRFDPARGAQEVAKLAGAAATCLLDRGEEILVGTEQG
ncbi:MAG: hypothetical protein ACRD0M_05355, partial [Acidimicrobiales bacterium]